MTDVWFVSARNIMWDIIAIIYLAESKQRTWLKPAVSITLQILVI